MSFRFSDVALRFFVGGEYERRQAGFNLASLFTHTQKNMSVANNGIPFELTFRISRADGTPFAGALVHVENGSGYVGNVTDTNGFIRIYFGERWFRKVTISNQDAIVFMLNGNEEHVDIRKSGLDFTVVVD